MRKRGAGFWIFVFMLTITAAAIAEMFIFPEAYRTRPVDIRAACAAARRNAQWKTYAELSPDDRAFLYGNCPGVPEP